MPPREPADPGADPRRLAPHTSGDLLVDRRFAYARAASAEGDHAAAAELLEQTLERAPNWAPLWFALAEAHERTGRLERAATAFARAAALDRGDELGAGLHLARLGAAAAPKAAPQNYVRQLFDQYADRFEAHLTGTLAYRGPDLLADALARRGALRFARAIDLGCGTGLCGARFRDSCGSLAGVDLSPHMIQAARAKGIYDRLETGAIEDFLAEEPSASASLVLAADVLVYFGDLAPVFVEAERILEASGHFAFTLQRSANADFEIGADMRFAHGEAYVERIARAAGLKIALLESAWARRDAGADAPGLVVVASRA